MPKPVPPTCTTVRACTAAPLYEITAGGKIRGLPARANVDPVHLFACGLPRPSASVFTRAREERTITRLSPEQPTLLDNEE